MPGSTDSAAAEPIAGRPVNEASTTHVLVRVAHDRGAPSTGEPTPWHRMPTRAGERLDDALRRVSTLPGIVAVAPEYRYEEASVPNDPAFPSQWHLSTIGLEDAWEYGTGRDVTVAVLDSGISTGGSDLACHTFVSPFNAFTAETGLPAVVDDSGHGTHITGTIAQCTNNATGAAGVAPEASIMPVKVLDGGNGSSLEIANGIHWAVRHGAEVVNLSLGRECNAPWPQCSDAAVDAEIEAARAAGVLVVVAAGNDGVPWVSSPGNHPLALAVGATTTIDTLAPYSNSGEDIDLVAPGGNWGDLDGDLRADAVFQETFDTAGWDVLPRRGTSSAAAHVSGVAALMRSIDPTLTPEELASILTTTSVDLGDDGWDPTFGAGRLDAAAAAIASVPPPITQDLYVLGGRAAIAESVIDELTEMIAAAPTRLAGADRYATAAEISKRFHPAGADAVFLVSGEAFADALAAGPEAARRHAPILLTARTSVPDATGDELVRLSPQAVVIVGGPAAIDASVADRVRDLTGATVTRIYGQDRYTTAAALSRAAFSPGVDHALVVTGEAYPDGLAAGPVAALLGGPVLLSRADHLPAVTRAELIRLAPARVTIVGGQAALSSSVEEAIRGLGLPLERVAGTDRYGTAAALSSIFFDATSLPVFLATGEAFPDALAGASAAGTSRTPILLTRATSIPAPTRTEIERFFP